MALSKLVTPTLMLALLTACSAGQSQSTAQPTAAPPPQPQQPTPPSPIIAWLDCVECSATQRDALRALGDTAVPELREVLLNGPTQDRLNRQQQHSKEAFGSLKKYRERRNRPASKTTEEEYVERFRQNFILRNRSRAASGLSVINTALALDTLSAALKTDLPEELRRDVERALKSPGGPNPVPNPDVTNPDVTNPDVKKPTPPKPPGNVKIL